LTSYFLILAVSINTGTSTAAMLYPLWGISRIAALDIAGAILAAIAVVAVKIPALPKTKKINTTGCCRVILDIIRSQWHRHKGDSFNET